MRGKVMTLLGLGLALTAPIAQAQGSRSEIVLRGHLREMRDDIRERSFAWSRERRAEALAHSRIAREQALASARIARTEAMESARITRESARAAVLAHRDDMRHTMRIHVPRSRPVRTHVRHWPI